MSKQVTITSADNPKIKHAAALLGPAGRRKYGEILVEGVKFVQDALSSGVRLLRAFYCDEFLNEQGRELVKQLAARSEVDSTSPAVFRKISDTKTPQGIAGVFQRPKTSLDDVIGLSPGERAVFVLLERVQDPGNTGTIIRAAAAAGATCVVLDSGSADPYAPKCLRASAGAVFRIPVVTGQSIPPACDRLRGQGICMIAAEPEGSELLYELDLSGPIGFVFGSEGSGLSEESLIRCDARARIPMAGGVESLNVGVSVGVFLYEAVRQRRGLQRFRGAADSHR